MTSNIVGHWWGWVLRGVAGIVFGILAFAWPGITVASLVILFGAYAMVDGILHVIAAFRGTLPIPRWLLAFQGIAGIIAGLFAFFVPLATALALTILIGAWALVTGALKLGLAIRMRHHIRRMWLVTASAILSIVFGILLMIAPIAGALALAIWAGAFAIIFGVLLISFGIHLRRHTIVLEPTAKSPGRFAA